MGKVPFISPSRLFGTGAIKARRCYLSLQKGLAVRRDEGKRGEERGKEEGGQWKLAESEGQTVYLFYSHVAPFSFLLFLNHPLSNSFSPPIFCLADTCCEALLDSASCCQETYTLLPWHAYNYIANSKSATLSKRVFPPKVSECISQWDKAQIAVGLHVC